jgi:hypothetical protein
MKQTCEQKTNGLLRSLRGQGGFSVLVVIFVMLVLSAIGYSMTNMMTTKQKSLPVMAESNSAFYLAESGVNWAGKQLSDLVSWSAQEGETITKNLGGGSFEIGFASYGQDSNGEWITVTSTGRDGNGVRVLTSTFYRELGYGCGT